MRKAQTRIVHCFPSFRSFFHPLTWTRHTLIAIASTLPLLPRQQLRTDYLSWVPFFSFLCNFSILRIVFDYEKTATGSKSWGGRCIKERLFEHFDYFYCYRKLHIDVYQEANIPRQERGAGGTDFDLSCPAPKTHVDTTRADDGRHDGMYVHYHRLTDLIDLIALPNTLNLICHRTW